MFRIPVGVVQAMNILRKFRPDVIFSKGGFVSVPVCAAGYLLRIPVVLHESDVSPGLANRLSMKFAKVICVSHEESVALFPDKQVLITGNPVRRAIFSGKRERGYSFVGFDATIPVVLVMGGSLGAEELNSLVWKNLADVLVDTQVVHITGKVDVPLDVLRDVPKKLHKRYAHFSFLHDELADVYAMADLVISRAGANALSELAALEKPAILFPLGNAQSRGDQIENAKLFAHLGVFELAPKMKKDGDFSRLILQCLQDEKRMQNMKKESHTFGQKVRQAGEKIADVLMSFIRKETSSSLKTDESRAHISHKIGINGLFFNKPYTGIGQYTRHLLSEILKYDTKNHYIIAVPEMISDQDRADFSQKNVSFFHVPFSSIGTAGMKKTFWEQVLLPNFFQSQHVRLIHHPYPCASWIQSRKFCPEVTTVHDTIPWDRPAYISGIMSHLYHRRMLASLVHADHIFTVSEASKRDILRWMDISAARITVTHNGISRHDDLPESMRKKLLERFGLRDGKFLLYVGGFDERKNVKRLVQAYLSHVQGHADIDLVLVGTPPKHLEHQPLYQSYGFAQLCAKFSVHPEQGGRVVMTGSLEHAELYALYRSCRVFIHLSLQEGFNLPLAEVLSAGSACLASDIPVHHEVTGDNAIFVDPYDLDAIGDALLQMSDDAYVESLRALCSSAKSAYSWSDAARKTVEHYEHVILSA